MRGLHDRLVCCLPPAFRPLHYAQTQHMRAQQDGDDGVMIASTGSGKSLNIQLPALAEYVERVTSPSPPTLCRRRCHHLPRPTRALSASSVASASILTPSIAVDASCRCHVLSMGRHLGPPGQFGMVLGISGTWTSTRTRSSGHTC